jgi:predicted secreted Zn-dependent protease
MTMSITVKKGTMTTKEYSVSGGTLADIWSDIQTNGPKHKGAARAGKTTCKVNMDSASSKIEFTTTQGSNGYESEAKMTKGTLKYNCTIQVPKLKSDKALSDAAKKEWARFTKALVAHENEHVADFGKEADKIGGEIDKLTAKGKGDDKKKAEKEALSAYTKSFTSKYSEAENDKRLAACADALDAGGHGPTLNTSIT